MPKYFSNFYRQKFPFRDSLANYLIDSINGRLLKKLHKTCKYFYIKLPFNLLEHISYIDPYGEPLLILSSDRNFVEEKNKSWEYVENSKIWALHDLTISVDTPSLISKIVRCDVERLYLYSIKLTFDELKFLTNSGKVKELDISNKVYISENCLAAPEDIFLLVPKANMIMMKSFNFSDETMQKLLQLNHFVKLKQLIMHCIDESINMDLLCKFLEKFLDPIYPHLSIVFNDLLMKSAFQLEICERLEKWEPVERKPRNFPYVNCHSVPNGFVFPDKKLPS